MRARILATAVLFPDVSDYGKTSWTDSGPQCNLTTTSVICGPYIPLQTMYTMVRPVRKVLSNGTQYSFF
jgi:hypothetical protein